jgi:hypothetical protein
MFKEEGVMKRIVLMRNVFTQAYSVQGLRRYKLVQCMIINARLLAQCGIGRRI